MHPGLGRGRGDGSGPEVGPRQVELHDEHVAIPHRRERLLAGTRIEVHGALEDAGREQPVRRQGQIPGHRRNRRTGHRPFVPRCTPPGRTGLEGPADHAAGAAVAQVGLRVDTNLTASERTGRRAADRRLPTARIGRSRVRRRRNRTRRPIRSRATTIGHLRPRPTLACRGRLRSRAFRRQRILARGGAGQGHQESEGETVS